ncbi:MAG: LysM peptidoglycan-binding domain-containing protein [Desulfobacteraceae bacterium]|nr:MAG: LysM peptidoglycan-binding domain-containing protein [Desulfobacteraceae bacterium]
MALVDCYAELFAFTGYLLKGEKPTGYEAAEKNFSSLIARAEECARSSGYSEEEWREAFFPVCAWIDESILCSDWADRSKWEHAQLQRRYFQTTSAGVEVFTRLAGLGEEARQVREVYAYCLAMGLRGAYYQAPDSEFQEIAVQNLRSLSEDPGFPQELFPDAYEAAVAGRRQKRKKWRSPSLFSVIVFIIPIVSFFGLFSSYDVMLSNEIASYLHLDVAPLFRAPFFKDRIQGPSERQVSDSSDHKRREEGFIRKLLHEKREEGRSERSQYKVKSGDTLFSIAGRAEVYGDSLMWPILYRYNSKGLHGLKEAPDLPVLSLPEGIKLLVPAAHEIQENKKKRAEQNWVINVLSTAVNDKAVDAVIRLVKAGHVVYLSKTKQQGVEWTRVRVGYFKTQAEADLEGIRIKESMGLPKIWSAKIGKEEFEKYAGY